jgi:hypothetical protein
MRASRITTQAQGVTLGVSMGLPVGHRPAESATLRHPVLSVRPGLALLAGWAEAQTSTGSYNWQGVPGTDHAGQTGTQDVWRPIRGRTTGAGIALGADLRVARHVAVTGSLRSWAFTGPVIRPNRRATLAGVGLAVHPGRLTRGGATR